MNYCFRRYFLLNQFIYKVCGAKVKTRDTLKQHRKKVHNLKTLCPKTTTVLDSSTGIEQTVYIKDEAAIAVSNI